MRQLTANKMTSRVYFALDMDAVGDLLLEHGANEAMNFTMSRKKPDLITINIRIMTFRNHAA